MPSLTFDRLGSGLPLVFLHAYPMDHSMWEPQVSVFSRNFQTICPGLPGFDGSPVMGDTSAMVDMAASVLNLLDDLKIKDRCVFTGLSMGGYVLFQILKLAPERIRALAFVSTKATPDTDQARAKRFENIEFLKKEGLSQLPVILKKTLLGKTAQEKQPEVVSHFESIVRKQNLNGITAALRGMAARPDMSNFLPSIKVPTLVISGAEDVVIPSAEMEKMSKQISEVEFHTLPEAGHLLNMEASKTFNDLFLHFLKRRVL